MRPDPRASWPPQGLRPRRVSLHKARKGLKWSSITLGSSGSNGNSGTFRECILGWQNKQTKNLPKKKNTPQYPTNRKSTSVCSQDSHCSPADGPNYPPAAHCSLWAHRRPAQLPHPATGTCCLLCDLHGTAQLVEGSENVRVASGFPAVVRGLVY